jgi:hypothetical protein
MEAEKKVEPIQADADKRSVERSTIEFPYLDLQNSFEIAEGVHQVGGSSCDWDQLAAHFKQAAQGGGFRLRLICAKAFGLVVYDRGKISLTSLGLRSVDALQQKAVKVEAFLNVPLYKAVYDKFRGNTLPPVAGLEREMVTMGVAKKQADKARQAFQRSAKYAGFFEFGADRLVAPSINGSAAQSDPQDHKTNEEKLKQPSGGGGGGDDGSAAAHPFIVGLLRKLPVPESDWSAKDRAKWLQTTANIFDLMYTGADDGEIRVEFIPQTGDQQ